MTRTLLGSLAAAMQRHLHGEASVPPTTDEIVAAVPCATCGARPLDECRKVIDRRGASNRPQGAIVTPHLARRRAYREKYPDAARSNS